ncbi:uncharacterized protein LOC143370518 isoform X2 [Andrena cerasifolii]|uniref:uncharacterized protein LOC143370518 isoform X2 n=1 Tax=Andrena cerasifolii TaxID=2819439 RepID=UPI0040377C3D
MNRNDLTLAQLRSAARHAEGSFFDERNHGQAESQPCQGDASNEAGRGLLARELDLMQREADLLRRELEVARRENEVLRNPLQSSNVSNRPNVSIEEMGDFLIDLDGSGYTFPFWEKQLRLLRTTYDLDDNTTRILIVRKLRGITLEWFHSKVEHIQMDIETLISELKKVFDYQPNKKWQSTESYREYHQEKVIMANRIPIEEDELIEYLIDGISNPSLQTLAKMQHFKSLPALLSALENLSQWRDFTKNAAMNLQRKNKNDCRTREKTRAKLARCFNCNQEGHLSSSCPKSRREKGSCFTCGILGHSFKNCPEALIELPLGSP